METVADPNYVRARSGLLDALAALGHLRAAAVLVGAQAVYEYIRDQAADFAVPPFTRDADLALIPELLVNEVLTEGWHPINEIQENGYANSFYMEDLLGFDEEIEAIVLTPMIEVDTDWDQPFDNYDYEMSVYAVLEDIGVDDELASEFRPYLMGECWRLVEAKGQSKPNSGFVDIFGLKVFEVYQPRQVELQQKLEQERQEEEDDWDDGIAAEMHRDVLWVSIREAIPLIANWIAETIGAEGESLVFNTLDRMSSEQAENAGDE